jgi:hypothetical protein
MSLLRCRTCVMPATRPDTPFIDGECAACRNYARRPTIDWDERRAALLALLDRHDGRVLVPSSGGKDSTYQVLTLLELGADVTIVTARTCHLTAVGRANIDNLARYARTIEVVPNMTVRAKLNRLGLEMVGDISWPEHAAIFSTPFWVAQDMGHSLLMFGECPQAEYGGPVGSEQAMQLTRRWRSEFGGFLGLRPDDFVGLEGITERDMEDYRFPEYRDESASNSEVEAHFLGQYIPWDSRRNAESATKAGMRLYQIRPDPCPEVAVQPTRGNWWVAENLDNAQTGLHDWFGWLKYRYSRGTAQISVDVRAGNISREHALAWLEPREHLFPQFYMGVHWHEVLDRIGMTVAQFRDCEARFTNRQLHGAA